MRKAPVGDQGLSEVQGCLGAGDLAGLDARGADVELLRRLADDRAHGLDVRVPAARGTAVRVRDAVAEARALAADVTVGSHGWFSRFGVIGGSAESSGRPQVGDQRSRRLLGRLRGSVRCGWW